MFINSLCKNVKKFPPVEINPTPGRNLPWKNGLIVRYFTPEVGKYCLFRLDELWLRTDLLRTGSFGGNLPCTSRGPTLLHNTTQLDCQIMLNTLLLRPSRALATVEQNDPEGFLFFYSEMSKTAVFHLKFTRWNKRIAVVWSKLYFFCSYVSNSVLFYLSMKFSFTKFKIKKSRSDSFWFTVAIYSHPLDNPSIVSQIQSFGFASIEKHCPLRVPIGQSNICPLALICSEA